MTDGSYDPKKSLIITSVNETVVSLTSDDINNPVKDIIIDNVAIQHGAWNINRTELAEAAFLTSVALFIANATSILISNVEISHTGSYGLRIMDGTSYITVINSLITDTGAGGVRIGELSTGLPTAPNTIKFISNEISYGGNVFPSGVGLIIHSGIEVVIADNTIHHLRYIGIGVGQGTGYGQAATKNILVQGNYIYTIGQHILCDQGGIYTLGVQPGTIINGNVIKNVFSYIIYMWGIYLDNASSDIIVSNNVVYNTGWSSIFHHYGANNTIINNVFPPLYPDYGAPDGDISIAVAENHLS
jgi:parallel beta-helix repeat protein